MHTNIVYESLSCYLHLQQKAIQLQFDNRKRTQFENLPWAEYVVS